MSEGFVPANNPCCGVHAIAEATGLPFDTVWSVAKFVSQKKASWRGRTTDFERDRILDKLGASYTIQHNMTGITLIEACYLANDRGGNYMLDIAGHSIAFRDGRLVDQNGNYHPTKYRRRFHNVDRAVRVDPVENFDEEKLWNNLIDPLEGLI